MIYDIMKETMKGLGAMVVFGFFIFIFFCTLLWLLTILV